MSHDEAPAAPAEVPETFSADPKPAPMCDWLPLHDKILVRREKPRESYDAAGAIAVAQTHQQAQNRGVVLQVGEGRLSPTFGSHLPLTVQAGYEVLFGKHSGIDIEDFPDLVILREDELLAFRLPAGLNEGGLP